MSITQARIKAQLELVGDIMRTDSNAKLYTIVQGVQKLASIAKALHKRYENSCSYQWACTDKYEKRTDTLEGQAVQVGQEMGITIGLQRDPRGWPLIARIGMIEHRLG